MPSSRTSVEGTTSWQVEEPVNRRLPVAFAELAMAI
jgi:hypothetical protein